MLQFYKTTLLKTNYQGDISAGRPGSKRRGESKNRRRDAQAVLDEAGDPEVLQRIEAKKNRRI